MVLAVIAARMTGDGIDRMELVGSYPSPDMAEGGVNLDAKNNRLPRPKITAVKIDSNEWRTDKDEYGNYTVYHVQAMG